MPQTTAPSPAASPSGWVWLAPLATIFIWSGNAIVTKMAAQAISPGSISFYRWALALLVLTPLVGAAAWRNRAAARKVWKQLLAGGVLGMVVYQCLSYVAAQTTTAVNIGVIPALMPLFSALLASFLAAERLTAVRIVGGLISIAGLVYLTSRGNPAELVNGGLHVGDVLMVVAVLSNALYGVLLRRWALTLPIWEQMYWQIATATVVLVPVWLLGTVSPITPRNAPLILYAAIAASLIAPAGWMFGISRLGAARTALTINLSPVIVALMAWLIIGERLQAYHYIGGGVALLGVIVGLREWRFGPGQRDPETAAWPTEEL
jgi:drug/metabolite transporter (DMT)-like permease